MKTPLISIIIPCFNHGQFIDEAIISIEKSGRKDYELIIINDGSTDEYTNVRLIELKKQGYNIILQKNQGLGKTRNNGIRIATGAYILPLDADNMITPEFLGKALNVFESNPQVSIVYSDRQLFGNSNECINVGEFNLSRLINMNYIDACAIYRKEDWERIGGYDENMPVQGWEDWDFWLSAAEKNLSFYYIPEPLFLYRVLDNSMLQQLNRNTRLNSLIEYIYKKHISLLLKEYRRITYELEKGGNSAIELLDFENANPLRSSMKYLKKWLFRKKF